MQMSDKTHWKRWQNPDYLGSYAFQPGEEKTVTIKEVKREMVFNPSGSGKEECTVAYFEEDVKPLILNVTNCKTISKVWGTPYVEDWVGRKITLKIKKVSAFGEMVDAVRVSSTRPTDEVITCSKCGKPIVAIPGYTVQAIAAATMQKYGKPMCMNCVKEQSNG